MSSTRWQMLMLAGLAGFAACASPSNVRQVQNEVALLRAESARQDSAQAARLSEVIRLQQRIMDSLGLAVRSLRGDTQQDLYNIQQQLVQLQELAGQSQQRLTELRTQLEARGAEISASGPPAAGGPGGSTDTSRSAGGGTPSASADQMYEASVAQLRRGARLPPGSDSASCSSPIPRASGYPTRSTFWARASQPKAPTRRRHITGRCWSGIPSLPGPPLRCTTSVSSRSAERMRPGRRTPTSG